MLQQCNYIIRISTLGGYGGLERTDFQQFIPWDDLVVLKGLDLDTLLWDGVTILKGLCFDNFLFERG